MTAANWISLLGLALITASTLAFTNNFRAINFRLVISGILLQLLFAVLVLGIPALDFTGPLRFLFSAANDFILAILSFSEKGANFVFGDLTNSSTFGMIFAFQVLPTILFMSTLMAILYHLGIMQKLVNFIAFIMQKTLKTSGAESLSAAANIFVGQTEAPLVIRPFVSTMTKSELFCVMVGGMATVAGGVMAAFVELLKDRVPDIAGHLLTASVLSAPAALIVAKIIFPETEKPETAERVPTEYETAARPDCNAIEAAARGALEGLHLMLNVGAMLIAFIALVAMVDAGLGWLGHLISFSSWGENLVPELLRKDQPIQLSAALILGWFFAPVAWLLGIPWEECAIAGSLLGQKLVLNEFVAYFNLSQVMQDLSPRTVTILSYALCGFANFSSIGIQIGGIGAIAPNRKSDLAQLGLRAVAGGTIAALMTGAVAGILVP